MSPIAMYVSLLLSSDEAACKQGQQGYMRQEAQARTFEYAEAVTPSKEERVSATDVEAPERIFEG